MAYMMALDSLLKKEENEDIKNGLEWAADGLKVKFIPIHLDEKIMKKYVGDYCPRKLTYDNGTIDRHDKSGHK